VDLGTGTAVAAFTESLTWQADGKQASYTMDRAAASPFSTLPDETLSYTYSATSRRLTQEKSSWTGENVFRMDYGFDSAGRGILTKAQESNSSGSPASRTVTIGTAPPITNVAGFNSTVAEANISAIARVNVESSNHVSRYYPAEGLAPTGSTVAVNLWETPVSKTVEDPDTNGDLRWRAPLMLRPSAKPYALTTTSSSGSPSAVTTEFGLLRRSQQTITIGYDDEGNVTSRVYADGRLQKLVWDGLNRLVQVIEFRTNTGSGDNEPSYAYRWTARYDGKGRRVLTTTEWGAWASGTFTPGTGPTHRPTVQEESWYDPFHEFLEIAVLTRTAGGASETAWKIHGPDANGAYGGLQGIGGLEAIYTQSSVGGSRWTGVVDNYYGHIVAYVDGDGASRGFVWHRTLSGGYGPRPDAPVFRLSEGAALVHSTAWRGKRQDITGFYYLGARYYEPVGGRFLSPDPFGHAASMSLYDYAGGDPVNFVDPDGRLQKQTAEEIAYQRSANEALQPYIKFDKMWGFQTAGWAESKESLQRSAYIAHLERRASFLDKVAGGQEWDAAFRDTWDGGRYATDYPAERYWAGNMFGPQDANSQAGRDAGFQLAQTGQAIEPIAKAVAWGFAGQALGVAMEGIGATSGVIGSETRSVTYYAFRRNPGLAAETEFGMGEFGHIGYSLNGGKTIYGFGPAQGATRSGLSSGEVFSGTLSEQSGLFAQAAEKGFAVRTYTAQISAVDARFANWVSASMEGQVMNTSRYALSNSINFGSPGVYNCVTFPGQLGLPVVGQTGHMRDVWQIFMRAGQPWP
jgi:RHS repeat-associated protein